MDLKQEKQSILAI